ncbi:uncharacterized protein ACA1_047810 [Acanthamoeba castellanii str. Neff]|uniref:Uncharacterized protein n=1 Tax=Acanthamoeba castellanii (strain ATCC 30010 / Neff) TaxID=1257118 RepID=L8GTP8_ACACF|nr:uncharacterized protein ACA1_047810 [Acanthamoeba castellanii str. Neff]ELR16390.1 hypothetical protein ACA1_047810 [Acanthamoeba castellanii str. Neff]
MLSGIKSFHWWTSPSPHQLYAWTTSYKTGDPDKVHNLGCQHANGFAFWASQGDMGSNSTSESNSTWEYSCSVTINFNGDSRTYMVSPVKLEAINYVTVIRMSNKTRITRAEAHEGEEMVMAYGNSTAPHDELSSGTFETCAPLFN